MNIPQNQIIKIYGELHNEDFIPDAYYQIFMDAQKIGATRCFIERSPILQDDTEEIIRDLVACTTSELQANLDRLKKGYAENKDQRSLLAHFYRCVLCAMTGVKPIHVDVAYRPLRMTIEIEAKRLSPDYSLQAVKQAAENFDLEPYVGNPTDTRDLLQRELEEIKREASDETVWWAKYHKDADRRLSEDSRVVERILPNLDGSPAIVIYGKSHTDLGRPNSLGSLLVATPGFHVNVYHIVGDRFITRLANSLVPASPFATEENPADAQAMLELGKSYYHGVGSVKDLGEAHYWMRKSSEKQDSAEADYYLSLYYLENRDYVRAYAFAEKAATKSYSDAYELLGQFCYKGQGTVKDDVKSHLCYLKAAEAGNPLAAATVAYNYLQGCGVEKDALNAFIWYTVAAFRNNENAIKSIKFAEKQLTPEQISLARARARQKLGHSVPTS